MGATGGGGDSGPALKPTGGGLPGFPVGSRSGIRAVATVGDALPGMMWMEVSRA